jgi:WhiB family redox-sensing transcriptional regulator
VIAERPNAMNHRSSDLELLGWLIEDLIERPAWHSHAACQGVNAELFFPQDDGPTAQRVYRHARADYCGRCPVVEQCRQAGEHERHGLWGGQAPQQRTLARQRRTA